MIDALSNSSLRILDSIFGITGKRLLFEKNDMREKQSVVDFFSRYKDIDGVIHFAASKAVGESVNNPLKHYENSIHSLMYLFKIQKLNIKL